MFRKGRKHGGKRRKCWLPGFSPFQAIISKGFFPRVIKSQDSVVNSKLFPKRQILDTSKLKRYADDNFEFDENGRVSSKWVENTEKRRNCSFRAIPLFSRSVFKRLVLQTCKTRTYAYKARVCAQLSLCSNF